MAKIIENYSKRRTIKLSTNDIITIIQQYQTVTHGHTESTIVRDILENSNFYIPEDI